MIKKLEDEDWSVRRNAAIALGEIGEPAKEAVPALIKALDDKNEFVRGDAVDALKKIGTPEAMEALEKYKKQNENKERK